MLSENYYHSNIDFQCPDTKAWNKQKICFNVSINFILAKQGCPIYWCCAFSTAEQHQASVPPWRKLKSGTWWRHTAFCNAYIVVKDKQSIDLGRFFQTRYVEGFGSFQLFFSWNELVRQNQAHSWKQNFMKWPGWHSLVHSNTQVDGILAGFYCRTA